MSEAPSRLAIAEVNRLSSAAFVARFGDVAEHSAWVAEAAARARPFASREAMTAAFVAAVDLADAGQQRQLLLAHPDLAGRAAIAGELTRDSRSEQASAGLDRLTPAEYARFRELNGAYRDRHGIPFIIAARGMSKDAIIAAIPPRLAHDSATEFAEALRQVGRIMALRLADRVGE